jgi:hypothetical protein
MWRKIKCIIVERYEERHIIRKCIGKIIYHIACFQVIRITNMKWDKTATGA